MKKINKKFMGLDVYVDPLVPKGKAYIVSKSVIYPNQDDIDHIKKMIKQNKIIVIDSSE